MLFVPKAQNGLLEEGIRSDWQCRFVLPFVFTRAERRDLRTKFGRVAPLALALQPLI